MNHSTPGLPVHHQLPEFTQNHVHRSSHLIFHCPLLLLPSIFPSISIFSNESILSIRWPKYGSFSLSISPSNEHPGLISFRMDWLDFLAAFFTVQLSHPYMTTGKTVALTRWTYVGKVMSLLFNMLSWFVIAFFHGANVFQFHGCSHHLQ